MHWARMVEGKKKSEWEGANCNGQRGGLVAVNDSEGVGGGGRCVLREYGGDGRHPGEGSEILRGAIGQDHSQRKKSDSGFSGPTQTGS